jgi:hypothetical protein
MSRVFVCVNNKEFGGSFAPSADIRGNAKACLWEVRQVRRVGRGVRAPDA